MKKNKSKNYWTKDKCKITAIKFKRRSDFRKKHPGAYNSCFVNKWLDEVCSHMGKVKNKNNYWTKERCLKESLKFSTRNEFQKKCSKAYGKAQRSGWLKEICSHMVEIRKPNGYWTKERCRKEALRFTSRVDFQKGSKTSYSTASDKGWLEEICSHMVELKKPRNYWTKERCQAEALKFNSKIEFRNNSSSCHSIASNKGWLEEICSHMTELQKPNGYWTKERCRKEALRFTSRVDFQKGSTCYKSARKNGWLKEICSHMPYKTTSQKRKIYAFEFSDNYVYVGLSYNVNVRKSQHITSDSSPVKKHIISNPEINYEFKILSNFIDVDKIIDLEKLFIKKYKDKGFKLLNSTCGGELGGSRLYWTKKRCQAEALKFNSKIEFRNKNLTAYSSAYRRGWIDEICSHMVEIRKPRNYWTKERCRLEALRFKTRTDFSNGNQSSYNRAKVNGWLEEICSHMVELRKPNRYWTKERCQAEALKFNSKATFLKGSPCCSSARRNGWFEEICSHMVEIKKPSGYWTKERCQAEALKFNSKTEFKISSAYTISRINGWLDEICSHMNRKNTNLFKHNP